MKPEDTLDLDRAHALMMAVLDDECTDGDRRELEAQCERRPELRAEWNRLRRVKEVTMDMRIARPGDEFWDQYRRSVAHRAERGIAWTLIAAGGAILASIALWRWLESWLASEVPLLIKLATGALMVGGALLLVSVLRERWVLSRRDPYSKEVWR
jgi:ferric-dicitrate binding protein FerR (iron transport regulator)